MVIRYNINKKIIDASALVSLLLATAVVITWRAGRTNRSRVSWNSQQLFVCPLCQSYKSKTSHKDIPTFKRKEQKQANPRRTKDVKQRCIAKRKRLTAGEEVNSLLECYHNKGNIPVRFIRFYTLPLGAIWNNYNACACLSVFVNVILMLIKYWPLVNGWEESKNKD